MLVQINSQGKQTACREEKVLIKREKVEKPAQRNYLKRIKKIVFFPTKNRGDYAQNYY